MDNIQSNSCHTLTEALQQVLQNRNSSELSIGDLSYAINDKGFGLVLIILSLPSALPIPAPGYSTPFGIAIAIIGIQMLGGRHTVWLPKKIRIYKIKSSLASKMIHTGTRFLRAIERFIRPRLHAVYFGIGYYLAALIVILMSLLMVIPIPLTNTFPAIVIFLVGIGLSERDGLLGLIAYSVGICAIIIYALIIFTIFTQGLPALERVKYWLAKIINV